MNYPAASNGVSIGVSTSAVQNWEQGRREPERPAKALLKIASKNPKADMEAQHS